MRKIFSSKTRRRIKAAYRAFSVSTKRIFELLLKLLRYVFSSRNKRKIKRVLKTLLKATSRFFKRASKFMMRKLKRMDRAILKHLKR